MTHTGRRQIEVHIPRDLDLLTEHLRLSAELDAAVKGHPDSLAGAPADLPEAEALRDLEARMEADQVTYVFEKIGFRRWQALLMEHPPTVEQRRTYGVDHHPVTFPLAAVAACSVEPKLTVEQVEELQDELDVALWDKVWQAVRYVNVGESDAPKAGTLALLDRLRAIGSTATASNGESPETGSLAGPAGPSPSTSTTPTGG